MNNSKLLKLHKALNNECKNCIYKDSDKIENCEIWEKMDGNFICIGKVEVKENE